MLGYPLRFNYPGNEIVKVLACRPVGAWRRQLVKKIHSTDENRRSPSAGTGKSAC
jgi:hypothetical protein